MARRENQRLSRTAEDLGIAGDALFVFLCECSDPFCCEYVKMTLEEYEIRRRGGAFITARGHFVRD